MTPAIILDVLIAAILLTAILRSSWRGLFLSLSGVIVLILTIIGANLGAKALTQPVADWATPKIEEKIAAKVEKTLEDRTQEQGRTLEELLPDSLRNLLSRTGLLEKLKDALARQTESSIAATARAIAAAVARELVESFAYAILYVLLFLALGAVLHVASLGISMLLRLPLLSSANTLGGALIFGMADDGQIVGLTEPDSDAEKISEIIKTRMEPIPEFRLRFHRTEDGKVLLILDVFKGEETPYYYSGDGTLEAFVRIGNESVRASATELKRLVLRGRNTSYDSQMTLYRVEDYAFSKLRERYKKWTGNSFDNKDLVSFGLADEGGFLTNAGALIADESPIRWSRLFCTRWNGLDKSGGTMDALDDAEYSGSVLSLIENGEAFIKRNARMMWRKTPNSREELPEYVERSYHEALVNALAHRDYLVYGSEVHIDIYDDRLEIYSPGGMPDGSMIQDRDPLTVPSTRRNPVLADVFNRLGYMERKGSGFGKILNGYKAQINYTEDKRPTFRSDRYQFTVVMPNLNYGVTQGVTQDVSQDVAQDDLDAKIIALIKRNNKISTEKMGMMLGVSTRTILRRIKKLDNVHYIGRGFSGHWEVDDQSKTDI